MRGSFIHLFSEIIHLRGSTSFILWVKLYIVCSGNIHFLGKLYTFEIYIFFGRLYTSVSFRFHTSFGILYIFLMILYIFWRDFIHLFAQNIHPSEKNTFIWQNYTSSKYTSFWANYTSPTLKTYIILVKLYIFMM